MGQCPYPNGSFPTPWYVQDCSGCHLSTEPLSYVDECGVCNGDGTSCLDCQNPDCFGMTRNNDSVITSWGTGLCAGQSRNGTKITDICGVCGGDSTTCGFIFSGFEPSLLPNKIGASVRIIGAGFQSDPSRIEVYFDGVQVSFVSSTTSVIIVVLSNAFPMDSNTLTKTVNVTINSGGAVASRNTTIYNNQTAVISTSPTIVNTSTSHLQTVLKVNDLIPSTTAYCIISTQDGRVFEYVANISLADSSITCSLPTLTTSQYVILNIAYSKYGSTAARPELYIGGPEIQLKYYDPAPQLLNIGFTDSGAFIIINFDIPISINASGTFVTSGSFWCSQLLSTIAGNANLQNVNGDCTVFHVNPTSLQISFTSAFATNPLNNAPIVGDIFVINNYTIYAANSKYSYPANGNGIIQAPSVVPTPAMKVKAPSQIGDCPPFTMEFYDITGSGGRPFTTDSGIYVSSSSGADVSLIQSYLDTVVTPGFFGGNTSFTFPSGLLVPDYYTFYFQLYNFLGGDSTTSIIVQQLTTSDIPFVTISGPSPVAVNQSNILTSSAQTASSCPSKSLGAIIVEWHFIGVYFRDGVTPDPDGKMVNISSSDMTKMTLLLPPYSLSQNRVYNFSAIARYNNSNSRYTFPYSFSALPGRVTVSSGSSRTISVSTIVLTAVAADTGFGPNDFISFSYNWTCYSITFPGACFDKTTRSTLVLQNAAIIDISNRLRAGTYRFSVTATNLLTGSVSAPSDPSTLIIIDGSVPQVDLTVSDPHPSATTSNFAVLANVHTDSLSYGTTLDDVTYSWVSLSVCNGMTYSTLNLLDSTVVVGSILPSTRTLAFTSTAFTAGSSYCIQVTITDPNLTNKGSATTVFTVRQKPSSGICSNIGPTTGTQFNTSFSFSCSYWTTDPSSLPLTYGYYATRNGGDMKSIRAFSTSSSMSIKLPKGDYMVYVIIQDAAGATAGPLFIGEIVITATVTSGTLKRRDDIDPVVEYINSLIDDYLTTQNGADALTGLGAVTTAIDDTLNNDITDPTLDANYKTRSALAPFINQLILGNGLIIDTSAVGPFLIDSLLVYAGTNPIWTIEKQEELVTLLTSLLGNITAWSNTECVDSANSLKIINILNVVSSSMSRTYHYSNGTSFSPMVINQLNPLLKQLENCVARTLPCGRPPIEFSSKMKAPDFNSSTLDRTVGVVDGRLTGKQKFCNFKAPNVGASLGIHSCLKFACGSKLLSGFYNTSSNINGTAFALSSEVMDLSLWEITSTDSRTLNYSSPEINVTLAVDQSLVDAYQLQGLDFSDESSLMEHPYSPTCVHFQYNNGRNSSMDGTWSDDNVESISYDSSSNTLTCRANTQAEFAVIIKNTPILALNKPPGTDTSSSPTDGVKQFGNRTVDSNTNTTVIAGNLNLN